MASIRPLEIAPSDIRMDGLKPDGFLTLVVHILYVPIFGVVGSIFVALFFSLFRFRGGGGGGGGGVGSSSSSSVDESVTHKSILRLQPKPKIHNVTINVRLSYQFDTLYRHIAFYTLGI